MVAAGEAAAGFGGFPPPPLPRGPHKLRGEALHSAVAALVGRVEGRPGAGGGGGHVGGEGGVGGGGVVGAGRGRASVAGPPAAPQGEAMARPGEQPGDGVRERVVALEERLRRETDRRRLPRGGRPSPPPPASASSSSFSFSRAPDGVSRASVSLEQLAWAAARSSSSASSSSYSFASAAHSSPPPAPPASAADSWASPSPSPSGGAGAPGDPSRASPLRPRELFPRPRSSSGAAGRPPWRDDGLPAPLGSRRLLDSPRTPRMPARVGGKSTARLLMSLEKLEREVAMRLRPLPRAPAQAPRLARPGMPSRLGGGKAGKGGGGGRRRPPRLMDAPTARASRAMDGHVRRLAGARASQFVDLLHDEFTKLPAAEDGSVLGQHLLRGLRGSRAVARALAAQGKAAAVGRRGGLPEGDPFLAYPALLALLGGGKGARVTWARAQDVLRQVGGAAPADWGKGPGEPGEHALPGGVREALWRELEPEPGREEPAGGDLYPAGGAGEGMGPVEEDDEDDLWAAGLPGPPVAAGVAAALPPGEGGGLSADGRDTTSLHLPAWRRPRRPLLRLPPGLPRRGGAGRRRRRPPAPPGLSPGTSVRIRQRRRRAGSQRAARTRRRARHCVPCSSRAP